MNNAKVVKMLTLSVDVLKENLHYNPETGIFTRIKSNNNRVKIGDVAGSLNKNGYIYIEINSIAYRANRLAWFYMTEAMPSNFIDHKNGIRHDNRFCNLRQATNKQNLQNQTKPQKGNKLGFLGVSFYKSSGKYVAHIRINGTQKTLGYFSTPEKAHEVYLKAKRENHSFCTI